MSDFSDELSHPPSKFSVMDFLNNSSKNEGQGLFCKSLKAAKEYATNHLEKFDLLARINWCRIADVFQNYLSKNLDKIHD